MKGAVINFHLLSLYQALTTDKGKSYHTAFDDKEVCKCLPEHFCQWIRELIHNYQMLQ